MDLFGRKKHKQRQSSVSNSDLSERSVPYSQLATNTTPNVTSPAESLAYAGLRGAVHGVAAISAPVTNPTLTTDGTDINYRASQWGKQTAQKLHEIQTSIDLRDGVGDHQLDQPPSSPTKSTRTRSFGEASTSSGLGRRTGQESLGGSSTIARSASNKSGMADFGGFVQDSRYPAMTTSKPSSRSTVQPGLPHSPRKGYASSIVSNGSDHHSVTAQLRDHLPGSSTAHARNSSFGTDGFNFPRPSNPDEIEDMFQKVRSTRGIGDLGNMGIDQKWQIVYNHEQLRWQEDRKRATQLRRSALQGQTNGVYAKDSPEWYLKKFMDGSITPKQVGELTVSIRGQPLRYAQGLSEHPQGL